MFIYIELSNTLTNGSPSEPLIFGFRSTEKLLP